MQSPLTKTKLASCIGDLEADPELSPDTRLWAMLQAASGGIWGGCVYDQESIRSALE